MRISFSGAISTRTWLAKSHHRKLEIYLPVSTTDIKSTRLTVGGKSDDRDGFDIEERGVSRRLLAAVIQNRDRTIVRGYARLGNRHHHYRRESQLYRVCVGNHQASVVEQQHNSLLAEWYGCVGGSRRQSISQSSTTSTLYGRRQHPWNYPGRLRYLRLIQSSGNLLSALRPGSSSSMRVVGSKDTRVHCFGPLHG